MKCNICANEATIKYELYDDRYRYPDTFLLFQCVACKHKFIEHNFTSSDLVSLYTDYYPRSTFSINDYKPFTYKKNFQSWLNGNKCSVHTYVPKNIKILDIGCGFAQSVGYHKARGCEAYGVEADQNVEKVANKYEFNVKVGLFDPSDYQDNYFDYVTMDQVLEHTTNPLEVMQGISSILTAKGKLLISIPNSTGWGAKVFGKKWINWHSPYHLQHFSKQSIAILAEKSKFSILSIKTQTNSAWLKFQWLSLLNYPGPGEKSYFWNGMVKDTSLVMKVIIRLLSIIHTLKINHLITRFFDAVGQGDNYVILLKKK